MCNRVLPNFPSIAIGSPRAFSKRLQSKVSSWKPPVKSLPSKIFSWKSFKWKARRKLFSVKKFGRPVSSVAENATTHLKPTIKASLWGVHPPVHRTCSLQSSSLRFAISAKLINPNWCMTNFESWTGQFARMSLPGWAGWMSWFSWFGVRELLRLPSGKTAICNQNRFEIECDNQVHCNVPLCESVSSFLFKRFFRHRALSF